MLKNKGQVTVFMILGIVILLAVGLVLYLGTINMVSDLTINQNSLNSYVSHCLSSSSVEAINYVFLHGGNYENNSKHLGEMNLPYVYYENEILLNNLNMIEEQVSLGIEDYFIECIDDFSPYNESIENIEYSEPLVNVEFRSQETLIELYFPIKISQGLSVEEIKDFSLELPLDFVSKYEIIELIVEEYYSDPTNLNLGYYSNLLYQDDYSLSVIQGEDNDNKLQSNPDYSIISLNYGFELEDEPLIFLLLLDYEYSSIDDYTNLCNNSEIKIEISQVENSGSGNSQNLIYYNENVFENLAIINSNELSLFVNSESNNKQDGLIVTKGDGYLHFLLEGGQTVDDLEIMDFEISANNLSFIKIVNDETNPVENYNDGISDDVAYQDEISINLELNSVSAKLRVTSNDDAFYLYYSCEDNLFLEDYGDFVPLNLNAVDEINITLDEIYEYQIDAEGINLTYDVDSEYIDIDSDTGILSIDPLNFGEGQFLYYVYVEDAYNDSSIAPLILNINLSD
ncbi:hypothetical protein HN385_00540 [archaeon]|jgi:hypothetical protein|nr:hypothetical protein [archaeon]MBT3451589.1 hypothetical protein [archaeon]MBT6869609.1 hypothetical protein [archaeon]MBT7192378.1 hypothetical protein [archaeon]MBT7380179.1 hypothetical protein [archaeon]